MTVKQDTDQLYKELTGKDYKPSAKAAKLIAQRQAFEYLKEYRQQPLLGIVNSVSRSGMTRRIEFYAIGYNKDTLPIFARIGYLIAKVLGYSYDANKGGMMVGGCGMDVVYHTISNLNYSACNFDHPEMSFQEQSAQFGRIYDNYFFDADRISR